MKAIPDLKTIENRFKFPLFRQRLETLPELNARNENIAKVNTKRKWIMVDRKIRKRRELNGQINDSRISFFRMNQGIKHSTNKGGYIKRDAETGRQRETDIRVDRHTEIQTNKR